MFVFSLGLSALKIEDSDASTNLLLVYRERPGNFCDVLFLPNFHGNCAKANTGNFLEQMNASNGSQTWPKSLGRWSVGLI